MQRHPPRPDHLEVPLGRAIYLWDMPVDEVGIGRLELVRYGQGEDPPRVTMDAFYPEGIQRDEPDLSAFIEEDLGLGHALPGAGAEVELLAIGGFYLDGEGDEAVYREQVHAQGPCGPDDDEPDVADLVKGSFLDLGEGLRDGEDGVVIVLEDPFELPFVFRTRRLVVWHRNYSGLTNGQQDFY